MQKVSVIYRPPKGDSKVCEWGEFTFFAGVPVEIEANDANAHMIKKISGNAHFELSEMGTVNKNHKPKPEAEPDPPPVPEEEVENGEKNEFEDYPPVVRNPVRRGRPPNKGR